MAEADAPPSPSPAAIEAAPSLEERERDVLAELAREVDARVSFTGLRRQLGVHQQALARTLRRLEAAGMISHDGNGYQLTPSGFASLRGERPRPASAAPVLPIVQARLPPYVSPGDVAAQLSRRWFGALRWYGQSEAPGETSLHWMAEKARVTLRLSAGSATLEIEDAPGSEAAAFAAARPVLVALAELYGTGAGLVESSRRSAA